jgi:hypothetical protein
MKVESLGDLTKAFEVWRRKKRHVREQVPDELLERARRAIGVHGLGPVTQATKIDRRCLERDCAGRDKSREVRTAAVPSFSRVELVPPVAATGQPFAELETPGGLKLRIFTQTEAVLGMLASVCGMGGGR